MSTSETKTTTTIEGGCLCGGVRFRISERPHHVCDCHCVDCRRASGAPFVTWGTVAREHIEILSGEVRTFLYSLRIRSFAGCCGTTLFFQDDESAKTLDVAIATLDDPAPFGPDRAIWTEDRLPWVLLDPARPAFKTNKRS